MTTIPLGFINTQNRKPDKLFVRQSKVYLGQNTLICRNAKKTFWNLKFGMIQDFECIDGTHISLKRPFVNSQDYFNYKQYFLLNVQAICGSKEYFMDVECK